MDDDAFFAALTRVGQMSLAELLAHPDEPWLRDATKRVLDSLVPPDDRVDATDWAWIEEQRGQGGEG